MLPYGTPPLIVVEGGGNDASHNASDEQITANANRLLAALKKRYPQAKLVMIGTLARGANAGGGAAPRLTRCWQYCGQGRCSVL
ncbi:conserved hypothetical protein [Arthrobacter sp. Hiyo8]|nr:conserved hypothetical protein [Arthrobacter sp. Hiyo8]